MTLDLTTVECFVAVAEERHFGHAAAVLGVSVSTVTKRLQRLEHDLGVDLVVRNSTGVSELTPAGQRFLAVAPELAVVAPLLPTALGMLELALRHVHPGIAVLAAPTPRRPGSRPCTAWASWRRRTRSPGVDPCRRPSSPSSPCCAAARSRSFRWR